MLTRVPRRRFVVEIVDTRASHRHRAIQTSWRARCGRFPTQFRRIYRAPIRSRRGGNMQNGRPRASPRFAAVAGVHVDKLSATSARISWAASPGTTAYEVVSGRLSTMVTLQQIYDKLGARQRRHRLAPVHGQCRRYGEGRPDGVGLAEERKLFWSSAVDHCVLQLESLIDLGRANPPLPPAAHGWLKRRGEGADARAAFYSGFARRATVCTRSSRNLSKLATSSIGHPLPRPRLVIGSSRKTQAKVSGEKPASFSGA